MVHLGAFILHVHVRGIGQQHWVVNNMYHLLGGVGRKYSYCAHDMGMLIHWQMSATFFHTTSLLQTHHMIQLGTFILHIQNVYVHVCSL